MRTPQPVETIVQMNKKNFALGLATLALSIANASNAQAALITGVTASTDIAPEYPSYSINSIVNGAGLSSLSLTATHEVAEGFSLNGWASVGNANTGNFTFNLNGLYNLAGFSVWNWNNNNFYGVKNVNILTSTDGINFTAVAGAPTQFAQGANNASESPEQFSFSPVNAAYVRFNVLSNQGDGIGLAEVQFDSASAATSVPEPLTIFGTFIGLGGGAALKRRLKGIKSKSV
jgi:F5/8 type C domain